MAPSATKAASGSATMFYTAGAFGAVVAAAATALWLNQDKLLYIPGVPGDARAVVATPPECRYRRVRLDGEDRRVAPIVAYEDIRIPVFDHGAAGGGEPDATIHAYWVPSRQADSGSVGSTSRGALPTQGDSDVDNDPAPILVHFHGNAGNIGHRVDELAGLVGAIGLNVLLVEYRGYGSSTGSPTEEGLAADAHAALDWALSRRVTATQPVVVFGRSLGGAVAIRVASDRPGDVDALIVENSFLSIADMGDAVFPAWLAWLPSWGWNKWPSVERVALLDDVPTLFISGTDDELIPPAHVDGLYEACTSATKEIARLAGGTHNGTWLLRGYYGVIAAFLRQQASLSGLRSRL